MSATTLPSSGSAQKGIGSRSDALLGFILVLPILLTMVGLVFYPLLATTWDSLHRVDPLQQGTPFVGLANYARILSDAEVGRSWYNTFIYVFLAVLLETVFGVLAAALINQVKYGRQWVLAAVVLPWALPAVVSGVIWGWIYAPGPGLLNGALTALGLNFEDYVWFNNSTLAMLLITLVHVWRMMPLTIVIVLAAMQSIPAELYEAARMDGAGAWTCFWRVTIPYIKSTLMTTTIMITLQFFNIVTLIYVMTAGGPGQKSMTLPLLAYQEAFQFSKLGYGTAIATVLLLIGGVFAVFYIRALKPEVD